MVVKRRDLLRAAADLGRHAGQEWTLIRSTGGHDVYRIAGRSIPVPRHKEINERTARGILRDVRDAVEGNRP